jgi:hypothetical protein
MAKYDIIDIDKFVETTRTLVYHQFGGAEELPKQIENLIDSLSPEELQEMNSCLGQSEAENILQKFVKKQRNKNTKEIRITISDDDYMLFIEELNTRMIGNMLAKLASQGVLETAFDEELNDFVFWAPDKNEKN